MGSANGRHRRPRQAPAIIVAAGVTGSAIAIPLLGAAGAHAADATTWDRVAECESGGMWSADLGNGSYGGLQFSQETWKAYGGESYAPRADLASRSQQIAVAEKVLDAKGPKAWPSCAVISGLAEDGSLPGVDPGSAPSADPSSDASPSADPSDEASDEASDGAAGEASDEASGSGGAKDSGTTQSKDRSDEADKAGEAGESATPSPSASTGSQTPGTTGATGATGGKHRGTPAPESGATGTDDRDAGRHASRGDREGRDAADAPGASEAEGTYTVHTGDNLWAIADAQEVPGGWPALYEANKASVGSDPDLILPGETLDLDVKTP